MSTTLPRTVLAYQTNAKLYTLSTLVQAITPFPQLPESSQQVFKTATPSPTDEDSVVVTRETIFHPQGGGQPSDVGLITSSTSDGAKFTVSAVRHDVAHDGVVLHLGRFASPTPFTVGDTVTQSIDVDKRVLYSRLHTAGHVLGAAVRHLLEREIPGFDELKASHFPDSAACEFRGLIGGQWKEGIQQRVNEYVNRAMPVRIEFWDEDDFRREGLERLIPTDVDVARGEKYRVVRIVGAEVYPCGGTHVETTDLCGKVGVRKISRQKGTSRVSYNVN
ncbi:alanyl-tRNA synthetase [Cladophialophora yegresii CBS 114405]|uniref:Alanyl-tRNA synthetase n=1 Tax=Cladophialophora yegresii CBS 114405 TaxID=1182544 RepID=W9VS59_9EURO|nr:alanyl-tRNA synthetase [Cladophialophora yegresii CBS 114405]EXJ58577.1 alanyl-tRNA synthetase [Cladophialophora yegresii CBS 114405]